MREFMFLLPLRIIGILLKNVQNKLWKWNDQPVVLCACVLFVNHVDTYTNWEIAYKLIQDLCFNYEGLQRLFHTFDYIYL